MAENSNLNLNAARPDAFFFRLGTIPSAELLAPSELTEVEKTRIIIADQEYFNLGLRTAEIPSISLGEVKIGTMFSPLADTDMKYEFGTFNTQLKLDNNYLIYKMLLLWIQMIKPPDNFNQYWMKKTFDITTTTGILTINNNFKEPVMSIEFYELRPLALPAIPLSYTTQGEEILIDVTWSYSYFMPKKSSGQEYSIQVIA